MLQNVNFPHHNGTFPYFVMLANVCEMLQITAQMSPLLISRQKYWPLFYHYANFKSHFWLDFNMMKYVDKCHKNVKVTCYQNVNKCHI
jgi:hypothetical protein